LNLQKLLNDFKNNLLDITNLCFDSRKAKVGDVFFAVKGVDFDGNEFISDVINKGVKNIVTDDMASLKNPHIALVGVTITIVPNVRVVIGQIADILYPRLPQHIVAATGTNGKSSVVSYCRQLFSLLGVRACSVGTIGMEYSNDIDLSIVEKIVAESSSLTTPNAINFRHILHNLAKNNIHYLAFEASSQGLDQERLYLVKVNVACFTSFSQDHLDYHKNEEHYLLSKLKLFTDNLLPTGIAILNSEMIQLDYIKNYLQERGIKFLTVGINGDLEIIETKQSISGQDVTFVYQGQRYNFTTDIIGSFQASNLLIATMLVHVSGFSFEDIISKLPKVKSVKGRMERVSNNDHPYHIFVDYAHTPEALERTLVELKKITPNNAKLKVIFGCGGNRDETKRPIMGQIAITIADEVIITDDNPRNEQPSTIRRQIIQGMVGSKHKMIEIENREVAIMEAITNLKKGDVLLIAGKGHENYQIIGEQKLPFSDGEIAKKFLHC